MRKSRSANHLLLADIPVAISKNELTAAPGTCSVRRLQQYGHVITGLRVGTVMFGKYLKAGERVTHPVIYPMQGVTNGGLVTYEELLAQYRRTWGRKRKKNELRRSVIQQG